MKKENAYQSLLLNDGKFKVKHSWTDDEAKVHIAGLSQKFTILHLSDNHITVSNESDIPFEQYGKRMNRGYRSVKHYKTGIRTTPLKCFYALLDLAKSNKVDMIMLTGDVVNNPSKTSVTLICDELKKTGIPYAYIAGNHDWHYEGMEGSANNLRDRGILPGSM